MISLSLNDYPNYSDSGYSDSGLEGIARNNKRSFKQRLSRAAIAMATMSMLFAGPTVSYGNSVVVDSPDADVSAPQSFRDLKTCPDGSRNLECGTKKGSSTQSRYIIPPITIGVYNPEGDFQREYKDLKEKSTIKVKRGDILELRSPKVIFDSKNKNPLPLEWLVEQDNAYLKNDQKPRNDPRSDRVFDGRLDTTKMLLGKYTIWTVAEIGKDIVQSIPTYVIVEPEVPDVKRQPPAAQAPREPVLPTTKEVERIEPPDATGQKKNSITSIYAGFGTETINIDSNTDPAINFFTVDFLLHHSPNEKVFIFAGGKLLSSSNRFGGLQGSSIRIGNLRAGAMYTPGSGLGLGGEMSYSNVSQSNTIPGNPVNDPNVRLQNSDLRAIAKAGFSTKFDGDAAGYLVGTVGFDSRKQNATSNVVYADFNEPLVNDMLLSYGVEAFIETGRFADSRYSFSASVNYDMFRPIGRVVKQSYFPEVSTENSFNINVLGARRIHGGWKAYGKFYYGQDNVTNKDNTHYNQARQGAEAGLIHTWQAGKKR